LGEAKGEKGHSGNGQNTKQTFTVTKATAAATGSGKNDTCLVGKTSTITVTQQTAAGVAGGTGYV
jgi:S-adenosylmethionine synthetase